MTIIIGICDCPSLKGEGARARNFPKLPKAVADRKLLVQAHHRKELSAAIDYAPDEITARQPGAIAIARGALQLRAFWGQAAVCWKREDRS
jgi:hypothetical protein